MAACSLFEEDEVCHVTPDNTYIYGLVVENSETVSSDEEGSRHDVCKKGCVRVAWHPKGKESYNTPENKVLLADRSLMVADIVRRFVPGQETQCGTVQDLHVTCHVHVTGTDKYIYNVDSKLLSPCVQLQKFDNGYVTMDNWLGRVEEVAENITLRLADGAKCEIDDSDVCYLDDISEKRPDTATFTEEYWYPGQQLKGVLGNLCNASWISASLLYNAKTVESKRNATFYAVVEKVHIRSIFVYWICRGYSKASISPGNKLSPPPREIKGADIERLQLVDWFDHCTVKLGDKMYYTVQEDDVLETQLPKHRCAPYAVQHASSQRLAEVTLKTDDLYRQRFDENSKLRRRGSKRAVTSSTSASSNTTTTTVVSSVSNASSIVVPDGAMATTATDTSDHEALTTSNKTQMDGGAGDAEAAADADDEYEDIDDGKDTDSGSDADSVSSSASGAKKRKRDKGVGKSIKSLRNASRNARRTRPVPDIKLVPGSRVATEVCYTVSLVSVMWQDGSLEEKVPSVELFPVHHMDELEFFPGSFVIDAAAPDSSNEYGVVTSCNHFERTCQVKWLKPYEVGQSACPTDVIKESEVSVFDIHDHPDYKFRPGHSVIRVAGFEDTQQTLQAVGQVVRTDPSGTVFVHWSDGSFTSSYPQDLYIVWDMSDYSNSSWESGNSSSSEEDSETDASWETEEEEEWKVDGGGDGTQSEEEDWDPQKSLMNDMRRNDIKTLMSQIQNFFGMLNDLYVNLSLSTTSPVQGAAAMDSKLMSCLKKVVKMYRACRKLDKSMKTGFFSTSPVLNLVTSIRLDMKTEKSNRIKQHLEHVFESNNKGLLDKDKDIQTMEVGTSTSDLCRTRIDEMKAESTSALGSPSKKIKTEDIGTSVDAEIGSSVDHVCASSNASSTAVQNGCVQDVERDISCRLAAANVDENNAGVMTSADVSSQGKGEMMGEKKDETSEISISAEGITLEDKLSSAAASGLTQIVQVCTLVEETLGSIQENVDKIYETMKVMNTHPKSLTSSTDKVGELQGDVKSEQTQNIPNGYDSAESHSCRLHEAEKVDEVRSGVSPDADLDMRGDNQEACDTPSNSSPSSCLCQGADSKADDEGDIVDPPGMALPQGFFMCDATSDGHNYISKICLPSNPKMFNAAVKKELKLLRSSLPDGIIIKGFEDRMDLFSVLIDGPSSTPYEDGVFLFDIMLPHDYPVSPPLFHYLSFCSDRLNPNLYADGKVCVSLLGTWSGKGMEVWTQKSNLLQVLVSIQGLILVDEPYYNEAGYEKQRGHQMAEENSRMYNEMALLKLVESMAAICSDVPKPFEEEVRERLYRNGPRLIERLRRWLSLSERMGDRLHLVTAARPPEGAEEGVGTEATNTNTTGSERTENKTTAVANGTMSLSEEVSACADQASQKPVPPGHPQFPLLPMSKGFRLTLRKSLCQFEAALHKLQCVEVSENGIESNHSEPQTSCCSVESHVPPS